MKLKWILSGLFSLTLVLGTASCGDEDDSGNGGGGAFSCSDSFVACGGEAAGVWNIAQVCNPTLDELSACPTATMTVTEDRSTGSANLGTDGNYTRNYDIEFDFDVSIPAACLTGFDCAGLAGMTGMTCADATDGCDCSGTSEMTINETGTWEADESDLVFDAGTAEEERTGYCISGAFGYTSDSEGLRITWNR